MTEAIYLERLTNSTEHEKNLHVDLRSVGTDWSAHIMEKAQVTSPNILDARISINGSPIETFRVEDVLRAIECLDTGFRLNPNLTILAVVTKSAAFWIDDRYLCRDRNHARILNE